MFERKNCFQSPKIPFRQTLIFFVSRLKLFPPQHFFPQNFSLWMLTVLNGPPQCKFIQIYSIQKGAEHTYVHTLNFTHSSMLKTRAHISPSISDSLFKSCSLGIEFVQYFILFSVFSLSNVFKGRVGVLFFKFHFQPIKKVLGLFLSDKKHSFYL